MFQLRRTSDGAILCSDGQWRPRSEIGGMTGHSARRFKTKGGAAGRASALPFVAEPEPCEE